MPIRIDTLNGMLSNYKVLVTTISFFCPLDGPASLRSILEKPAQLLHLETIS